MNEEKLYSGEAEQALLAIMLHDKAAAYEVAATVKSEHMAFLPHQVLLREIERQMAADGTPDGVTVAAALKGHDAFEELGGVAYYVADVLAGQYVEAGEAAQHYARLVRDFANKRALRDAVQRALQMANAPDVAYADALEAAQAAVMESTDSADIFSTASLDDAVDAAVAQAGASDDDAARGRQMRTGLHELDKLLGAMVAGDFVVVAARPSIGKTVVGAEVAGNVAEQERLRAARGSPSGVVAFFSLEMNRTKLGFRFASSFADRHARGAGPSYFQLQERKFTAAQYEAVQDGREQARGLPLEIIDTPGISVLGIRAICRKLQAKRGLAMVVVDYLQLVEPHTDRRGNREREVADISKALKQMAESLAVPVIALAQINRDTERRQDNRPQLADLRESGAIEADADKVVLLYREAYYAAQKKPPSEPLALADWHRASGSRMMDFIIAKNRGGPLGSVSLECDVKRSRIYNEDAEGGLGL